MFFSGFLLVNQDIRRDYLFGWFCWVFRKRIPRWKWFIFNLVCVRTRSSNPNINVNGLAEVGVQSVTIRAQMKRVLRDLIEVSTIEVLPTQLSDTETDKVGRRLPFKRIIGEKSSIAAYTTCSLQVETENIWLKRRRKTDVLVRIRDGT